jgi:hypothetical protein
MEEWPTITAEDIQAIISITRSLDVAADSKFSGSTQTVVEGFAPAALPSMVEHTGTMMVIYYGAIQIEEESGGDWKIKGILTAATTYLIWLKYLL